MTCYWNCCHVSVLGVLWNIMLLENDMIYFPPCSVCLTWLFDLCVCLFLCLDLKVSTSYGFCDVSKKLVDVSALLRVAEAYSLPGLGVCVQRETLVHTLRVITGNYQGWSALKI